jgi:hypothetical protein
MEDLRSTRDDAPLPPTIEITPSPAVEMMEHLCAMEEEIMASWQNLQYLLEEMTKLQARVKQPSIPAPTMRWVAEPAKPSEFDGDWGKGCAFLNSCLLYLCACRVDFADDQTKILWVLSFMKSGRAAVFAAGVFAKEAHQGQPAYPDWASF